MKQSLLRIILVMTVGGGFLGVFAAFDATLNSDRSGLAWLTFAIAMIAYIYGIIVGVLVSERRIVGKAAIIFLVLQVPYISSPFVLYHFTCAAHAILGLGEGGPAWNFRLGSEWQISIFSRQPWAVGINLIPLTILLLLYFQHRYSAWRPSDGASQALNDY